MIKGSDIKMFCLSGFISFFCSGCVLLALGAGGVLVTKIVKKVAASPDSLKDEDMAVYEVRNISGTVENVFSAINRAFKKNDFTIEKSDYDKQLITASSEELGWQITVFLKKKENGMVYTRIVIKEDGYHVENKRVYHNLFNDVQKELESKS